jgi:hypothetical protein
MKEDNAY